MFILAYWIGYSASEQTNPGHRNEDIANKKWLPVILGAGYYLIFAPSFNGCLIGPLA
jgi:hypothetical protein